MILYTLFRLTKLKILVPVYIMHAIKILIKKNSKFLPTSYVDNDIFTVKLVGERNANSCQHTWTTLTICECTCDDTRQRLSPSVRIGQAGFISLPVIMWQLLHCFLVHRHRQHPVLHFLMITRLTQSYHTNQLLLHLLVAAMLTQSHAKHLPVIFYLLVITWLTQSTTPLSAQCKGKNIDRTFLISQDLTSCTRYITHRNIR